MAWFIMPYNKLNRLKAKFLTASGLWRDKKEDLCHQEECSTVFQEVPGKLSQLKKYQNSRFFVETIS